MAESVINCNIAYKNNKMYSQALGGVDTTNKIKLTFTDPNQIFFMYGKSYLNGSDKIFSIVVSVINANSVTIKDSFGNFTNLNPIINSNELTITFGTWIKTHILSNQPFYTNLIN